MAITLSSSTVTYNDGSTTTTNTPNATAALGAGAIGSYAMCSLTGNATVRDPGFTVAGSSLLFAGGAVGGHLGASATAPSGSWRLMGALATGQAPTPKGTTPVNTTTSVWLRYA